MSEQSTYRSDDRIEPGENSIRVTPRVLVEVGRPATLIPTKDAPSTHFTEDVFEDAIDKVSRPVKGKYAHILPSSEEFIREKRREVELEDHPS